MKRILALFALSLLAGLGSNSVPAAAQSVGFGGGIALPNDAIAQLPAEMRDDGWTALESRAANGFYVELRGRLGLGLPLIGSVSYNRFVEEATSYTDGSGRSIDVTSSQITVPATVGIEHAFSDGIVAPYATLEASGSYLYRTFESREGDVPLPLSIEPQGDMRYGAVAGLGVMFDLPLVRFDATARYHLVNLFGSEPDEDLITFGQVGVVVYVGL